MASVAALSCRVEDAGTIKPFLDMINSETSRINQIIDDMLELSRSVSFDSHPNSITRILEDVLRAFAQDKPEEGVKIEMKFEDYIPPIRCDAQRLRKAIAAIVQNAYEAGATTIVIQGQMDPDNNSVMIQIRDNGEGLPPEAMQKAFEPFYSTRRKKAGLGLSVVDHVIRSLGGNITLESSPAGTSVKITLPVK
jgi:two-component system sporulation sensor kinase A